MNLGVPPSMEPTTPTTAFRNNPCRAPALAGARFAIQFRRMVEAAVSSGSEITPS
jgi:hypothetical protein